MSWAYLDPINLVCNSQAVYLYKTSLRFCLFLHHCELLLYLYSAIEEKKTISILRDIIDGNRLN